MRFNGEAVIKAVTSPRYCYVAHYGFVLLLTMTTKPKASATKKAAAKKSESVVEGALQRSVGIRELRQEASRVLDLVKKGEVIIVTERGTPIAEIVPIKKSKLQLLIEEGVVTPAKRPFNPANWQKTDGPSYPEAFEQFLKDRHEARY